MVPAGQDSMSNVDSKERSAPSTLIGLQIEDRRFVGVRTVQARLAGTGQLRHPCPRFRSRGDHAAQALFQGASGSV